MADHRACPVVDSDQYPQLYSPYIMPTNNDGTDIWFTMSMFGPYDVSMMHTLGGRVGRAGRRGRRRRTDPTAPPGPPHVVGPAVA